MKPMDRDFIAGQLADGRERRLRKEIPQAESHRFRYDNCTRYLRLASPACLDTSTGKISIRGDWTLIGWCRDVDERLMHGREGQAALLFFHREYGEVWEHYPWYPEDGPLTAADIHGKVLFP